MSTIRLCGPLGYCNALRASDFQVALCPHCDACAPIDIAPRFEIYWHHPHQARSFGQVSAAELRAALDLAAEHAFEGGPSGFALVFDCAVNRVIAAFEGAERIDGGTL